MPPPRSWCLAEPKGTTASRMTRNTLQASVLPMRSCHSIVNGCCWKHGVPATRNLHFPLCSMISGVWFAANALKPSCKLLSGGGSWRAPETESERLELKHARVLCDKVHWASLAMWKQCWWAGLEGSHLCLKVFAVWPSIHSCAGGGVSGLRNAQQSGRM